MQPNEEWFIQWVVGMTDGNGSFSILRKGDSDKWNLTFKISQSTYNLRGLYYIKKKLGVGSVSVESNRTGAYFIVRDRITLGSVIIPIFDKYPLLTTKYFYYNNFKQAYTILENKNFTNNQKNELLEKISLNSNIPSKDYISPAWNKFNIKVDNTYTKVIAKPWLIGFVEAEGSFYFIKNKISNIDKISQLITPLRAEFRLAQNNNFFLLNKIKEKLKISRKVSLLGKSTNHFYIVAASTLSLQNVINFYTNPNIVKFKGEKFLQFILWLKGIKNIVRHNKVKIPVSYGGDSS